VAVSGGRILAVAPDLPREEARDVVDATGLLVLPGLVDAHTHVFPGATYWGIDPDGLAWSSGVTTWIDAGTAGAFGIDALRATVGRYGVRVRSLLNIASVGLAGRTGESLNLENCDVELARKTVSANRDLVVGIKVRMDRHTVGDNGLEPLRRAREVADECALPIMMHIGHGPPAVFRLVDLLRPGDIVTHCASGVTEGMVTARRIHPAIIEAHRRGVVFDIGHGFGGFSFDVVETQLAAGLRPHLISTDLHARSLYGPVFDLPTTMNKLLAVGMDLAAVVAATTSRPAEILGLPDGVGTLAPGAPADIALFSVQEGAFTLSDAAGNRRTGTRRLVNAATFVAGHPLPPRLPAPPPPWISLTDAQRAALKTRERALRELLTTPLVGPDGLDHGRAGEPGTERC